MSDYTRARIGGGTYFFTLVTFDRRLILTSPLARTCLRKALRETRAQQPFQLDAICLLPDHLHCLWTLPAGDADFSGRWNRIKGLFSKRYLAANATHVDPNPSRHRKGEATVWQRRFWEHCIRDVDDLRRHLDYLHFNPVKHGHVSRATNWPWSSLARYVRLGWYDPDWEIQEPPALRGVDGFRMGPCPTNNSLAYSTTTITPSTHPQKPAASQTQPRRNPDHPPPANA